MLAQLPVSTVSSTSRLIWEDSPCPLCNSTRSRPVIEAPDPTPSSRGLWFAVVSCAECGLRYTNPRPSPECIGQFYPSDYVPHRRARQLARPLRKWIPLGSLRGRASERRSLPWQGQGRLLDFGCGSGSFLARMAEQGWNVVGLDVSASTVKEIQSSMGLEARVGTLPHPDLEPGSFDVITMWHSLEHVHEPLTILREANRLLVPGGRLLVAVPNIESWPFQWFQQNWFGLDLPRHLTHFDPTSLRRMLEKAGFHVESLRGLRHSDWLRSSAKLAAKNDSTTWWKRLLKIKPVARFGAWMCYAWGRADCILAVAVAPE